MNNLLFSLTLIFSTSFMFSSTLFAQTTLEEMMGNYYLNYLPEKVFLQTDKNIYAGGESLWLAVYLTDGDTHRPGTYSKLVRVELHNSDNEVLVEQKLFSDDGYLSGEIHLPATLKPGDYQLTAYTSYQRNSGTEMLFRKTVRIVPGLKESGAVDIGSTSMGDLVSNESGGNTKLRFFPEGGDCVNGIPCRIAYVAEGASGQPVAVEGHLTDGSGAEISTLQTDEFGMGSFIYIPETGRQYRAVIKGTKTGFDLPAALKEGFHLSVQKRKSEMRLLIETNNPSGAVRARIGVHLRGFVLVDKVLDNENSKTIIDLPLANLTPGVHVATLLDQDWQPVAERLFFIAPEEGAMDLQITADKANYGIRQPVNLKVQMPINNVVVDSLASGKISMSVLPFAASGGPAGDDIRTWLLLNSDLDHPVPFAPELLFANDAQTRDRKVDEFLLTRGWRRFRWEHVSRTEDFVPEHLLEMGLYLQGRMGKYDSPKKPQPGTVSLTQMDNGYFEEKETDEMGHFAFGPYQIFDTMEVILQGKFSKGKKEQKEHHYTHLEILDFEQPQLPPASNFQRSAPSNDQESDYVDLSQKALTVSRNYDSLSITLDVVDVKSTRISPVEEERKERTNRYGGNPDNRIILDSLPGASAFRVFDLLRRVPGVQVSGSYGNESIEIRGKTSILLSSEPAYYMDGFEVDIAFLRNIEVADIEFVDVIKGVRAANLGGGGANGAILFYSRRTGRSNDDESPGVLKTNIYGFHRARQFAVFDPMGIGNQNRPDLRTTLHWCANRTTDKNGTVLENFNTSDQTGKFIIIAQGLRRDGRPFYGTGAFEVK